MVGGIGEEADAPQAQVGFAGGFPGEIDALAEGGDEDGGEEAEDGDDDEQFDEGKGGRPVRAGRTEATTRQAARARMEPVPMHGSEYTGRHNGVNTAIPVKT